MIMVSSAAGDLGEEGQAVAVVVTVAKGYDLGYVWKNQAQQDDAEKAVGGYYINAAQAGEPPGRWWGPGAKALGFTDGRVVERGPYDAVYQQRDPVTGEKLGRSRGSYVKFSDHLARLQAAEPHATAERQIELEREAAKAARQPAAYTDVTVSFSKSISVLHASIRENAPPRPPGGRWAGRGVLGGAGGAVSADLALGEPGGAGVPADLGRGDPHRLSRGAGERAGAGPVRGRRADRHLLAAGHQP
jgi:hypothetical protein